jgi:hypothetical protein
MNVKLLAYCLLSFKLAASAQFRCEGSFIQDTMSLPEAGKVAQGEYLQTTLKNLSVVKLFKTADNRYYLKFIVTRNFYFDKIATLEIRSGSKSYYARETKQHKIDKTTGMFVIEVMRNYIVTLKDEGITSIVFNEAETDFTKQDANQIRQIAGCFYESIKAKK